MHQTFGVKHITDLGRLSDELGEEFARALPDLVLAARRGASTPPPRATYQLSTIEDLAHLADEHIAALQADIPSLVATLRVAQEQNGTAGDRPPLSHILPHITFAPALGDVVVLCTDDSTRVLAGAEARAAATPAATFRREAGP